MKLCNSAVIAIVLGVGALAYGKIAHREEGFTTPLPYYEATAANLGPDDARLRTPNAAQFVSIPTFTKTITGEKWFAIPNGLKARVFWPNPDKTNSLLWANVDGSNPEAKIKVELPKGYMVEKLAISPSGNFFTASIPDNISEQGRILGFGNTMRGSIVTSPFFCPDGDANHFFAPDTDAVWSPDEKRVAFTASNSNSDRGDIMPRLGDASGGNSIGIAKYNSVSGFAWQPNGDLMATEYSKRASFHIVKWTASALRPNAQVLWMDNAKSPNLAPDGSQVAFLDAYGMFGSEAMPLALSVADQEGRNRRIIYRYTTGNIASFWMPDSKNIVVWRMIPWDARPNCGTNTSDPSGQVKVLIENIEAKTGAHRTLANLQITLDLYSLELGALNPLGLTKDGKYLLYTLNDLAANSLDNSSLQAVRLTDGKVFPIAAFENSYVFARPL